MIERVCVCVVYRAMSNDFPTPPAGTMPAVPPGSRTIEKEEAKEMIAEMSAIVEDPANAEKIEAMKEQLKNVGDSTCICMCVTMMR